MLAVKEGSGKEEPVGEVGATIGILYVGVTGTVALGG